MSQDINPATGLPNQEGNGPLPNPEEIQRLLSSMRASVLNAYDKQTADIQEAEAMIEAAKAEQARLREVYPMFFPPREAASGKGGGHSHGTPKAEHQNLFMRLVAEHPNLPRRRLAKQMNLSESWLTRIEQTLNQIPGGPMVQHGPKHGRLMTYALTEAGQRLLDGGGVRDS